MKTDAASSPRSTTRGIEAISTRGGANRRTRAVGEVRRRKPGAAHGNLRGIGQEPGQGRNTGRRLPRARKGLGAQEARRIPYKTPLYATRVSKPGPEGSEPVPRFGN